MRAFLVVLGNRIKELREQRKWSQEEFADLCGLHRTAVGFLERAERNPRLDTLLIISKGLGITVSELLQGLERRSHALSKKATIRNH
jgi:transcriptional regulator with XRE-family HTH domain